MGLHGSNGEYTDYKQGDYFLLTDPKFLFGADTEHRGTASRDILRLCDAYQTVRAGAGDDVVTIVGANNALVYGDAGNDFIGTPYASTRNPTIYGGAGNDTIRTSSDRTYADGGDGNDRLIALNSVSKTTLIGGAGNDTMLFITSSTVTASGGDGTDVYLFNPYAAGTLGKFDSSFHNAVLITDISSSDVIRYDFSISDGTELSWSESNGNIILDDAHGFFTITLQGGASKKSELAKIKYQSIGWSGTLGELFPELTEGGNNDMAESTLIANSSNSTLITGTSYADSIKNSASYVTINSGAGNDTIYTGKAGNIINSGAGDDYVDTYQGTTNVQISGGEGNDTIKLGSNGGIVNGDAGNDYIQVYAGSQKNTIYAGTGNDIIYVGGDSVIAYGGAGNDYFYVYSNGYNQTVIGGDGKDSAFSGGENVSIDTGDGNDYIHLYTSAKNHTVTGGTGDDVIKSYSTLGTVYRYSSGDGNDSINGISANDTLRIENTTFSTMKSGSDMIITAGSGKITVTGGANVAFQIIGDSTPDTLDNDVLIGTSGADSLSNSANYVTISGLGGNDTITNYPGNYVSISGGAGNDVLDNSYGYMVTVDGDAGNDIIYNTGEKTFINGGAGNDTIINEGIDDIDGYGTRNSGKNVTIKGGTGNDSVYGCGFNEFYLYENGDGNDTIFGIGNDDTIKISGTTYSTTKSGTSDLIITAGSGSILVQQGAAPNVAFTIIGTLDNPTPTPELVIFNPAKTAATITADYAKDTFDATAYSKLVTIIAEDATTELNIIGNAKNNKIFGSENNDTLYGGKGTDTLKGNGGDDTFHIVKGEGNKVIADYTEGEDIIYVEGADVETVINSASVKSGNVIFKVGSNKITVKGGDGQVIAFVDEDGNEYTYPDTETVIFNSARTAATITSDFEEDTFDAADYDAPNLATINASEAALDLTIIGNEKANSIIGSENSDCISGGEGNDTLTGGSGEDIFVYNDGDGSDLITDYTEGEDRIEIYGADVKAVIASASVKSGNVIFKVGSGNITVRGGDGQEILFVDEDGNEYIYPTINGGLEFNPASTSVTVTAYYEDSTFDAADYSKLVMIDATEAAIDLEILGNAKNNKIFGSENNDTLYGGQGTDTLKGNGGDDTFHIVKGEGNKFIADYTEGEDIIFVEGADVSTVIASASVKSGNVIFKVGTNNVTVKGGDGQEILFVDEDGNEYTYPDVPNDVIFNPASTSATITAYYEDETFDAADYSKLVTIDATEAAIDLEILGNAKNNKIFGSENNDTLYGGQGTDTLKGNGGDDTFHIVKGEGNKVIADYAESEDIIYVEGAAVSTVIKSATVSGNNVVFKVGTNKLTVKNGKGSEITFMDADGDEYSYGAAVSGSSSMWFTEDDTNFISDTPQLDAISAPKYYVTTQETSLEIFAQDKQELPLAASAK